MASLVDKYFSRIDLEAIEKAVHTVESTSGGEIAVVLASQCRNWKLERLIYSAVAGCLFGTAALWFTRENNWGMYYNFTQAALWGAAVYVAAFFGWGQFLKRRSRRQKAVWLRAVERFERLTPVRNLAGILILVSLEEGEAAIVADTGIASEVSPDFWQTLRTRLIEDMKQGRHAEGLIRTIEAVGMELARFFPCPDDDVNELPDDPTIID